MKNISLKQFLIDACGLAIVFTVFLFCMFAFWEKPMGTGASGGNDFGRAVHLLGVFLTGCLPIKIVGAILPRFNHNLALYTLLPLVTFYMGESVIKFGIKSEDTLKLSLCIAGIIIGYIWPHKRAAQYQQETKENVAPTH